MSWPRGCARMARGSYLFFLSSAKHSLLFLWPRPYPNGVGLTQQVHRLSVVSTNMGRVLLYFIFLTGQPPFLGAASLSSTPVHVASFVHFLHSLFDDLLVIFYECVFNCLTAVNGDEEFLSSKRTIEYMTHNTLYI